MEHTVTSSMNLQLLRHALGHTVTHPSQRDSGSSSNQAAFPEEDIPLLSEKRWFCGAIVGAKFSTHRAEERQP